MSRPSKDTIQKFPELFRNAHFVTGVWRAIVVRVDDPENRARVQVRVLKRHPAPVGGTIGVDASTLAGRIQTQISTVEGEAGQGVPNPGGGFDGIPDDALPWAEPCFPFGGQKRTDATKAANGNVTDGFLMLPSVGSTVWIIYEQGFIGAPVWLGGWYGDQELPPEFTNPETIRMIKTPAGHLLIMDDGVGTERFFIATTDDDGMNMDGTRIRFIEMDDAAASLTLQNAPAGDDVQFLIMRRMAKTIQIQNGAEQVVTLDAQAKKATYQNSPTQTVEQDGTANTTTVKNGPTQTVVQDGATGTTTITDGITTITMTAAGAVTITNGTATIAIDAAGNMTVDGPASPLGAVLLGTGAVQGVCLESLITVIAAMVTKFNTHTHDSNVPVPAAGELQTAPVIGVNSSTAVRAKV